MKKPKHLVTLTREQYERLSALGETHSFTDHDGEMMVCNLTLHDIPVTLLHAIDGNDRFLASVPRMQGSIKALKALEA